MQLSTTAHSKLNKDLGSLAELIANVTESYTATIFLADTKNKVLRPSGFHTLSRDFIEETEIPYGSGLVGWTAENKVRISVCPFENDATTLLYYESDQSLKSFIAVPIICDDHLLGVIACDSKKSYAYAKITEKILTDCANQAASIIELHRSISDSKITERIPESDLLQSFIEFVHEIDEEDALLHATAKLPLSIIKRNALVVMTCDTAGSLGKFYSDSKESTVGHRLIEMIYRHKRVLCSERSVHALPFDDASARSFLSVPFHCLGKEAGSINLLSFPDSAFSAAEISALEKIAKGVGRELERIRLIEYFATVKRNDNGLSMRNFLTRANKALELARNNKGQITLSRISIANFSEIEKALGLQDAQLAIEGAFRLLEQIVRPPSLLCQMPGLQSLILSESSEAEKMLVRFKMLLQKQDLGSSNLKPSTAKLILAGLQITSAIAFKDAEYLDGLIAKTIPAGQILANGYNESLDTNYDYSKETKVA